MTANGEILLFYIILVFLSNNITKKKKLIHLLYNNYERSTLQYLILKYLEYNKKQLKRLIKHKNVFGTRSDQIILINNKSLTKLYSN